MGSFIFTKTGDGSVGLFNQEINDIYHAKQGAYQEACEKFSLPAIEHLKQVENNKILYLSDICYGIGYNTISFIEKLSKDKIIINYAKIKINAFELDEELIILSPFIISTNYNWIIRLKLLKSIKRHFSNDKICQTLDKYCDYTDNAIYKRFKGELRFVRLLSNISMGKSLFLHNTYYNYVSNRHNNAIKISNIKKFNITYNIGNARFLINNLKSNQNIVFLDAFDPKKCPTLWTKEFFDLIYSKMEQNSKLFTYSHATSIRAGMLNAKFFIGNNNEFGTVAAKDKSFIYSNLSNYELGLLNTNAGICYKDYNKVVSSDELIQDRLRRMKLESRESSTHYAKTHQK